MPLARTEWSPDDQRILLAGAAGGCPVFGAAGDALAQLALPLGQVRRREDDRAFLTFHQKALEPNKPVVTAGVAHERLYRRCLQMRKICRFYHVYAMPACRAISTCVCLAPNSKPPHAPHG